MHVPAKQMHSRSVLLGFRATQGLLEVKAGMPPTLCGEVAPRGRRAWPLAPRRLRVREIPRASRGDVHRLLTPDAASVGRRGGEHCPFLGATLLDHRRPLAFLEPRARLQLRGANVLPLGRVTALYQRSPHTSRFTAWATVFLKERTGHDEKRSCPGVGFGSGRGVTARLGGWQGAGQQQQESVEGSEAGERQRERGRTGERRGVGGSSPDQDSGGFLPPSLSRARPCERGDEGGRGGREGGRLERGWREPFAKCSHRLPASRALGAGRAS
ncbi:unnamed protein product [Lampetra planeri]